MREFVFVKAFCARGLEREELRNRGGRDDEQDVALARLGGADRPPPQRRGRRRVGAGLAPGRHDDGVERGLDGAGRAAADEQRLATPSLRRRTRDRPRRSSPGRSAANGIATSRTGPSYAFVPSIETLRSAGGRSCSCDHATESVHGPLAFTQSVLGSTSACATEGLFTQRRTRSTARPEASRRTSSRRRTSRRGPEVDRARLPPGRHAAAGRPSRRRAAGGGDEPRSTVTGSRPSTTPGTNVRIRIPSAPRPAARPRWPREPRGSGSRRACSRHVLCILRLLPRRIRHGTKIGVVAQLVRAQACHA